MDQMKMSSRSILRNFNKSKQQEGLPVSRGQNYGNKGGEEGGGGGIRRRLSSVSSLKIQLISSSVGGGYLMGGRSKSMSSVGEYAGNSIRKWWEWGWDWILSRKPIFALAQDLEMNQQQETQGSWRHVFYKLKCELGKLVGGPTAHNSPLPKTTLDLPPPPPCAL